MVIGVIGPYTPKVYRVSSTFTMKVKPENNQRTENPLQINRKNEQKRKREKRREREEKGKKEKKKALISVFGV